MRLPTVPTRGFLSPCFWLTGLLFAASPAKCAEAQPTPNNVSVPPGGFQATCGDHQVRLSWDRGTETAAFNLKRSLEMGPFTNIAKGIRATSFVDTDVTNDTVYHYIVSAVGANGVEGDDSLITGAKPGTNLTAPTNAKATGLFEMIRLKWDAVPGAVRYEIRRLAPADGKYHVVASPPGNIFYDDDDWILDEVNYSYRILSIGTNGKRSALSPAVTAMKFSKVEDVPSGLTASPAPGQVKLDWDDWPDAQDSHTTFGVKRSLSTAGPFETIASGLNASEFTDTKVDPSAIYYYAVYAQDYGGVSHDSDKVSAVPLPLINGQ